MRMNWNLRLGLVACLIGFPGLSESTPASAGGMDPALQSGQAQGPHKTRTVIASVKVNPTEPVRYELSIAPCRQRECPFQVRLLQGETVLSSVNMDWVKASGDATKEPVDESSGAGDPLRPDTNQTAWSTGAEKENVSTVARGVRLTPHLTGLLIDRRAGFDVLKRHHDLFVAVNQKLVLAWSDADGAGPSWSTVALSTTDKDGSQDILSFSGFRSLSDTDPDRLQLHIYHWNSRQNKLLETPTPVVIAVIAGSYDNISKARAVQNGSRCLDPFWVLPTDAFSTLKADKFVLAAITSRKELAAREADALRSCAAELKTSMISSPYRPPDE
jgi:hypothetical protein